VCMSIAIDLLSGIRYYIMHNAYRQDLDNHMNLGNTHHRDHMYNTHCYLYSRDRNRRT
jgi:hypothetical protein